jgi:phosphate transport system protein
MKERHFEREIAHLRDMLLRMGGRVELTIEKSVRALLERDSALAREVILEDDEIDRMELALDDAIVEILSRVAPVASDLRLVMAISRITPELERIADLSGDVAERVLELNREPQLKPLGVRGERSRDLPPATGEAGSPSPLRGAGALAPAASGLIPRMAEIAREMLRSSLDALVRNDPALAQATIDRDDEVDALMETVFRELLTYMMENPKYISRAIRLTFVAKYFERIADAATNICEQVVYEVEGKVVKHSSMGKKPRPDPE